MQHLGFRTNAAAVLKVQKEPIFKLRNTQANPPVPLFPPLLRPSEYFFKLGIRPIVSIEHYPNLVSAAQLPTPFQFFNEGIRCPRQGRWIIRLAGVHHDFH